MRAEHSPGGRLQLKLWGVRGSIPTPVAANLGFGGNTICIEVRYPGLPPIIIDGGSGLRELGIASRANFRPAARATSSSRTILYAFLELSLRRFANARCTLISSAKVNRVRPCICHNVKCKA